MNTRKWYSMYSEQVIWKLTAWYWSSFRQSNTFNFWFHFKKKIIEKGRGKPKYNLEIYKEILGWQGHLFFLFDKENIKTNHLNQLGKIRINVRQNRIYKASVI